MQKILKLTGISMLAIMATANANAAGYTCEELIEYTSCNPGYALSMGGYICPDGYVYKTGICNDAESYYYGVSSLENCEPYTVESPSEWWAGACVKEDALQEGCDSHCWIANEPEDEVIFVDGYTPSSCNECLAGYYCAGGTAGATPCPAGSYCATAGLSQPTGKCNVGTYSTGGATACTSCPASDLIDANGNVVSVTTASTGSTSSSECFVAKGTLFKDEKGIYKYTDNCKHGNYMDWNSITINNESECTMIGGEWYADDGNEEYFCYLDNIIPETEEECVAVGLEWVDAEMDSACGCIDGVSVTVSPGITGIYCDMNQLR